MALKVEYLTTFSRAGVDTSTFGSAPPILMIWLPPTALQEWPLRELLGGYGTLIQWNAGKVRMLMVSNWTDSFPKMAS